MEEDAMGAELMHEDVRSINQLVGRSVISMGVRDKASRIPLYVKALSDNGGFDKLYMARMITSFFIGED
jgi:hypothetical protein